MLTACSCARSGAACNGCPCPAWTLQLRDTRRCEEGWATLGLSEQGPGCRNVASLWPPPPLSQDISLWAGPSTPAQLSSHVPLGRPTAYSKSPSRYLPKAWRITVLTAMSGFTTQNCRVACWGRRPRVGMSTETMYQAPSLARWTCWMPGDGGRQGGRQCPHRGDSCLEEVAEYVRR